MNNPTNEKAESTHIFSASVRGMILDIEETPLGNYQFKISSFLKDKESESLQITLSPKETHRLKRSL